MRHLLPMALAPLKRMPGPLVGLAVAAGLGSAGLLGFAGLDRVPLIPAATAQGTPSILEFRWENSPDYRKLYYFVSNTQRLRRSDYYLLLRPRDRKTAILKLSVTIPSSFDATIDTKRVRLCKMNEGGMLSRTRCLEELPATIELAENGRALEIFPDTPIPDTGTVGVHIRLFNPYNTGMYQFNALAQAPGDVPISGYLGSWLIQIEPTSN